MISVHLGTHRFNYRAGAVIIHAAHLLLHKRSGDDFWAVPGGRVNVGETASDALAREFQEELAVAIECGGLLSVGENFFRYDGVAYHELGMYFAVTLPPSHPLHDKSSSFVGAESDKALEFKWFPLSELENVDMRPLQLRQALAKCAPLSHFVQFNTNAA